VSGGGSFGFEGQSLKLSNCDCFAYFVHGQVQDAKLRDAVVNLQPLADTDKALPADFAPSVLDAMRWENSLYAIPAYSNVRVLFYNKNLFDKAGMPYPQAGWTLEEFRETALRLSAGEGGQRVYGYVPLDLGASDFGYFVAQKGGFAPFSSAEYAQAPAALDADRITDAVRWYTGLAVTDKVMPRFQIINGEYRDYQKLHAERLKLIQTGRAAMWTDALASSRTPAPTLHFGVAPLPSDSEALLVSHPVGYMISSTSEEREACWNWITFLTQEPLAVRNAPVRQAFLANSSQLQPGFGSFTPTDKASATAELLAAYAASLPRAEPHPGRENGYLYEAFDAIMDGAAVDAAAQAALTKDTAFQQCLAEVNNQTVSEQVQRCLSKTEAGG
jgi:multiple sugar transport system substrate-binding protein